MATDNQLEAIRQRHNQQPPSTITKSEWDDIDYLLAEIDRLKGELKQSYIDALKLAEEEKFYVEQRMRKASK